METQCAKTESGEHVLQAQAFHTTSIDYICTVCGESVIQWVDNQGC